MLRLLSSFVKDRGSDIRDVVCLGCTKFGPWSGGRSSQ